MRDKIKEALAFKELTPEEKEKRGILCRLYGPCADIAGPTRNGRKYSDELWGLVFDKNELVKELLANGGIPGEAQHPTDRDEIDTEKIALMMPEAPKKDDEGHLIAYYDVLDTPCGRILYQLAKYGFKLGISSRGTGDIITDEEGEECVDPSTYDFTCFDAVIIPSVKDARLTMVESLNTSKTLQESLKETLDSATPDEKKIMLKTLEDLDIEVEDEKEKEECNSENCADIKEEAKEEKIESEEAVNDGSKEIIDSLKEALKEKLELETTVKSLKEQLAVSNTKVNSLENDNSKDKSTIVRLTSMVKELKESLKGLHDLEESLNKTKDELRLLQESKSKEATRLQNKCSSLTENINHKTGKLRELQEENKKLKESYDNKLNEATKLLNEEKSKNSKLVENLNAKVEKQNKLIEAYKSKSYQTVERYINSKAVMLGVTTNEIKNRLGESYTLDDIDNVCDELRDYQLRINSLPFRLENKSVVKVRESVKPNNVFVNTSNSEDDIDEDKLMRVAG